MMGKDIRIVIAQRGWVFVGEYKRTDSSIELSNAKSIRRWGTTKGLGQLCNGPKEGTVLDLAGELEFHPLQIITTQRVSASAWEKPLSEGWGDL